jgi:amylosucrase
MGDEVGLLNDKGWADDPAHAGDNRWVHRPRMPWPAPTDTDGIREGLDHLLHVRASLPHLHAACPTEVWDPRDPGVLLVVRRSPRGPLLAAANMTDQVAHVPSEVFYWLGMPGGELHDHLTDDRPTFDGDSIALRPYAAAWLTAEPGVT